MKWTIDEINFIKEQYSFSTAKSIAEFLGRPVSTVIAKIYRLKLSKIYKEKK